MYAGSDADKLAYVEAHPDVLSNAPGVSASVSVDPSPRLSESVGSFRYIKSHPAFAPEAIPTTIVLQDSTRDDGIVKDVPLGFDFEFYGATYDKVQIYSNGLLMFGPAVEDQASSNFAMANNIPNAAIPNNVIAFAWSDWDPSKVADAIRFETRGSAPHRRFLLQFNNVPEHFGRGLLMMQLVLTEGSNDITIYTNTMTLTCNCDRYTQGLENSDGTVATFDSLTLINGLVTPRVRGFFKLTNDAVRFTPPQPPVVNPPQDVMVRTEAASVGTEATLVPTSPLGKCDAQVDPGLATASSQAGIMSIVGVRSDDAALPLVGRYPKGITTITWTAKDSAGVTAQRSQLVTVVDKENPLLSVPADDSTGNDPHLPSAVVNTGLATADDNCHDVTVTSTRSDGAALSAPFMVGLTTITWTATDGSGNTASGQQSVKVSDIEAPTLATPDNRTVNATTPSGAVVTYPLDAADNVAVTSLNCNMLSGTVFPIGESTVECTASDAAGNTKTVSFKVVVVDAKTQMWNLMQYIGGLGVSEGVSNPLFNQVSAAYNDASLAQECKKMGDFLFMLSKKNQTIPTTGVTNMITDAGRIMTVLGCANAPDAAPGSSVQLNKS